MTTNERVVGDPTKAVVSVAGREHGSKTIFQIISSCSFKTYPVDTEPRSPKHTTEPIHVAIIGSPSIVPRRNIHNALYYPLVSHTIYGGWYNSGQNLTIEIADADYAERI